MVFSDWWITNLAHGWWISIRRAHWCRHYYIINCTLIFSRQITYVNYNCKHTSYGWKNRQEVRSKLLDKIRWLYIFSLKEIVDVTIMHPFSSLNLEIDNNWLRERKSCNFSAYYSTITMNTFWAITTAEIHFMSLVTCVATIFRSKVVYCWLVLYVESFSSTDEWIVT